jgi:hypothetical protein
LCGAQCVDVQTNGPNCGACGNTCSAEQVCMAGTCREPLGPDGCSGSAQQIAMTDVAAYQTIKIPLTKTLAPIATTDRLASIVQNRTTLFRVFVKPDAGFVPHQISARLTIGNGATVDHYFAKQQISKVSSDADSASTFQISVPPEKILDATTYSIELADCASDVANAALPPTASPAAAADAGAMLPPTGGAGAMPLDPVRFPATGEATLDARKIGVLKVMVIPVVSNSHTPDTTAATLKIYEAYLEAMYPIDHAELTVGTPLNVSYPIDWNDTIDQLRSKRQAESPPADVYYFGFLMPMDTLKQYCRNGCTAGVGYVSTATQPASHVAVGLAFGDETSAAVMAHEVGHNHGRSHAPCAPGNNISGVDPNYPYPNANAGVWGYDSRNQTFFDPASTKDIMGYCDPKWISDYNYKALIERVATINLPMETLSDPALLQRYQVMLLDARGPRWSQPFATPDAPFGEPEQADVLDLDGQPIERVTVYRTEMSDSGGFTVLVPEPKSGWNALRLNDGSSLAFSAPITVPALQP